ncbi:hypothetical protein [Streptomyces sp. MZ04]|uniref:hypothetical protein n=1 Tax=Streptomyces sp. MZ04 TaxID=2559236 RepID=UPI00107EB31D|nr:hypothetical protein [Streptomyces sp. MZ04]TGB06029.1 hypothetical protein E2651_23965 [Streptomyces sp. MZ04]
MGDDKEGGGANGAGGFSGIDPEQLSRTIHSLDKDQDRLKSSALSIKSRFQRYGVDTEPLTDLLSIAGWCEKQLPMLRRRHHLSVAEDQKYGHGYAGMVRIDESKVGQTKQARADGKKLGEKFKKRLDDGERTTPEMFADLRANRADADYVKAFYTALGPQRLAWVTKQLNDPDSEAYKAPEQQEKDRKAIFDTFATYTQVAFEGKSPTVRRRAWEKWLDGFKADEGPGFRPDWLAPRLKREAQDETFSMVFDKRTEEEVFVRRHREPYSDWLIRVEAHYLTKVPGLSMIGEERIAGGLSTLGDAGTLLKIGGGTALYGLSAGKILSGNAFKNGWLKGERASAWWGEGGSLRTRIGVRVRGWDPPIRSIGAPKAWLPGQLGNLANGSTIYQNATGVPFTSGVRGDWIGEGWDRLRRAGPMRSTTFNRFINWGVGSDALASRFGGLTHSKQRVVRAAQADLWKVFKNSRNYQRVLNGASTAGRTASPFRFGLVATAKTSGAFRNVGIAGGVVSTGVSAANVWSQGDPRKAYKKKGAGYVADLAETGFNASLTSAMVCPNPWTIGATVGTGLVYGGAKVVEHWDDIEDGFKDGVGWAGDTAKDIGGGIKKYANPLNWG